MSWSLRFDEPIVLAGGAKLATLREAVAHLGKAIPKSEHSLPAVLTAAEQLTRAAEHGGPVEFARIATLQGAQPSPCPAVFRRQGSALGPAEVAARAMTGE